MKSMKVLLILYFFSLSIFAQEGAWYYTHETDEPSQVSFVPEKRLVYKVRNTLDIERKNVPVVIKREGFPLPDIHEMWITVVDPKKPPYEGPSKEVLRIYGGHNLREEVNGAAIFHQLDDLDKDGIWDELFFQTDLEPNEERTFYFYIGENIQGWNKHKTHANVGNYCRHLMPFWESENVGWKIWFANCVDVYGKREPVLMAHHLYMDNLDGYGVSAIDHDWGSDIQSVAGTMGGGAICLFEHPEKPGQISLPRFTPVHDKLAEESLFNAGQISDTRYAYEPVVNGPIRSIIKIKTMNWNTGQGSYALEQYYTVYANQSYSSCKVKYLEFNPRKNGVMMGCGLRKKPGEEDFYQEKGIIISSGPEAIRDPEDIDERAAMMLPFVGKAMVVKDEYKPDYQFIEDHGGNHTFRLTADENNQYEYMIFAAWSEGAVLNNKEDFEEYVKKTQVEYNNPVETEFIDIQQKNE